MRRRHLAAFLFIALVCAPAGAAPVLHDSHLHLTNYVQEGVDIRALLAIMGDKVGRAALFGIPLQQLWSHRSSAMHAPTYYLDTDTPLYYYSFTDAHIAMAYRSLDPKHRARFDPMITGFNPADMYAADHVRRVLRTFPGVFCGIGEFTVHKEFVSSKVAGEVASLNDPALDRLLDLAAEAGLVVLLHNDVDAPFAKDGRPPEYLEQLQALFRRHPSTTIIWAHAGLGRVIHPIKDYALVLEALLTDPRYAHVHLDLSWAETAKYVTGSEVSTATTARLVNRHPSRFLFGTDEVAPRTSNQHLRTYEMYQPLWAALSDTARALVLKGNYERVFDKACRDVRAWEKRSAP